MTTWFIEARFESQRRRQFPSMLVTGIGLDTSWIPSQPWMSLDEEQETQDLHTK